MHAFHQYDLSLHHGSLAVIELGPNNADNVVLFLHGWQDNAATFLSTMTAFSVSNPTCRLIAFDWFGHGLSDHKGVDNFYHFFDYVDDLHQAILSLKLDSVILVGHSLGGLIASAYSAAFPEKVAALMMIEALGPLSEEAEKTSERLREGVLSRQRYRHKPQRTLKDRQAALALRSKVNQLPEVLLEPIMQRAVRSTSDGVQWTTDAKVKCESLYRMSEAHALALLSDITCPVIVIIGVDGYGHLKQKEHRYSYIQHVESFQIEGGHHCHLQHPEKISTYLNVLFNKINT
ncbi:alpha/beta fold hydrolase [Aliivibrio salmonicida]|uniref:alpha/beta fold hydrolase n=1 Tax=Aliivibrio salmonicida TaxID=40269 RepID=UPI003D0E2866